MKRLSAENPELVEAMTLATLKAIQYTIDNPDEAYEISKVYVPNLAEADQSVQKQVMLNSIEQWKARNVGLFAARRRGKTCSVFCSKWGC